MLEELQRWLHYKCFSRAPRTATKNIVDVRWVLKWKLQGQPPVRKLRARLTVRGFRDHDADWLQ
eukprot:6015957-Amphidinium_carterae.1